MVSWAFATVLTSDSYLPGALVTAHSIKHSEKDSSREFDLVCVVTLDSVSVQSIKALRQVYDLVVSVEEIRSIHSQHELNLLGRQDLSSTITKIHIWRLTQYQKLIYLDSDTLLLRPISHLFELDSPFSACPDIGWPDCFNSGLMVITPNSQTFENLFQHFLAQGSWDGGDQGLLNDFFSPSSTESSGTADPSQPGTWNRLSFIYNVTPSAYYTYAPAYKRYHDQISMIHFIGSEKPWHLINRRRYRNTYFPSRQSQPLDAVDYDSLVDRWLDVYEKAVGPVKLLDSGSIQPQFQVPKYLSQWDSAQPSIYKPPSLEELKETFSRKRAQFGFDSWNVHAAITEAGYISLPFLDLSSIAQQYFAQKETNSRDNLDVATHEEELDQWRPKSESGRPHKNELNTVWDASRSSPPTEGYQMNQPFTHRYESVWDKPLDGQSHAFFQPPPMTHSIPAITHQDYSRFSSAPQPQAVKAVFPWEDHARPQSTRAFPGGGMNDSRTKIGAAPSSSDSSPHRDGHLRSASNAMNQGSLRSIYRNAWDEDPKIGRWAHARNASASSSPLNSGWGKFEAAKAALAQTPRLELKSFIGDHQVSKERKSAQGGGDEGGDVGRLHSYVPDQNWPLKRTLVSSSSYQSERESEGSSQDADEEDAGEDEDQSSDHCNETAEETGSDGTLTTPTERIQPLDPRDGNEKTETQSASMDTPPRVPTTRSVIVGVPMKLSRSSNNPDDGDHQAGDRHGLRRTSAGALG